MKRYKDQYNVILLDWAPLAFHDVAEWGLNFKFGTQYLDASKNAVDVGEFVGRCLDGLVRYQIT